MSSDGRPLYVELVEESFSLRKWGSSVANLITFAISILFLSAFRSLPVEQQPAWLLTMGFLLAIAIERNRRLTGSLLPTKDWNLRSVLLQIPAGVSIGLAMSVPLAVLSGSGNNFRGGTWTDNLAIAFHAFVMIAIVESFLQAWVWPAALPYGPITAQVLFALLHPRVIAGDWVFAIFAFFAGLAFWLTTAIRYWGPKRLRPYFGLGATVVAHGTADTVFALMLIIVAGFELSPLGVG